MKKMVSLLLVVLFLTAACSNKATATSSTSGTSDTTDVAEADATSDTGATADEDESTDEDDSAETDVSESSAEKTSVTKKNSSSKSDRYWLDTDKFDLRNYCWDFPEVTEFGTGWNTERTKKDYLFCKVNDWKAMILDSTIYLDHTEMSIVIAAVAGPKPDEDRNLILVDNEEFWIPRKTLDAYLSAIPRLAKNPEDCPFEGTGISHSHSGNESGIISCRDY